MGVFGRLNAPSLLWIAAPLVFLGLADAGCAAREKRCAELLKNGKNNDLSAISPSEPASKLLGRFIGGLCSVSVWPFYLFLWGVVIGGAFELPRYAGVATNGVTNITPLANVPSQPILPPGYYNKVTEYPPGVAPRYPNGAIFTGPVPPLSAGQWTPSPAFPKSGTPPGIGFKPPERPPFSPAPGLPGANSAGSRSSTAITPPVQLPAVTPAAPPTPTSPKP